MLPVDGAEGVEGPLHVLVELLETIFPPELHQVDPTVPPRVGDLLKAAHLSIHAPLSDGFHGSLTSIYVSIHYSPRCGHAKTILGCNA